MMAILMDRHLQSVANYLILSLALADLLVAVLVMPLGAIYEVRTHNFNPLNKSLEKGKRKSKGGDLFAVLSELELCLF